MDCSKVGALLYSLRKEKGMTQKQVASCLNISDKTISKWERGMGCPDVSLLGELSRLFDIHIEKILDGHITSAEAESGNLKHIRFYVCPACGNVVSNMGTAEVSCCGRMLTALTPKPEDDQHRATVEDSDDAFYITFQHEMRKDHYLSFVAYIANDRLLFVKLYPEQEASVILPKILAGPLLQKRSRVLYYYCTRHGLFQL